MVETIHIITIRCDCRGQYAILWIGYIYFYVFLCLAKGKSIEEIALLSSILVLIGDNLDAIAAQEALCLSIEDAKRNKIQKEVEHNLCKDV